MKYVKHGTTTGNYFLVIPKYATFFTKDVMDGIALSLCQIMIY